MGRIAPAPLVGAEHRFVTRRKTVVLLAPTPLVGVEPRFVLPEPSLHPDKRGGGGVLAEALSGNEPQTTPTSGVGCCRILHGHLGAPPGLNEFTQANAVERRLVAVALLQHLLDHLLQLRRLAGPEHLPILDGRTESAGKTSEVAKREKCLLLPLSVQRTASGGGLFSHLVQRVGNFREFFEASDLLGDFGDFRKYLLELLFGRRGDARICWAVIVSGRVGLSADIR